MCYVINVWAHWNGVLYMKCQIYETAWCHIWIFSGHNYFCNCLTDVLPCVTVCVYKSGLYNSLNTTHLHIYTLKTAKILYGMRDLFLFFSPPLKICIDLCIITRKITAHLCLTIDSRLYVTVSIALVAYILNKTD